MGKTIWHCHIAMSLDGKIASTDGSFDWRESYPLQEFGFDAPADLRARARIAISAAGARR
ncbi:MAG: hypothetical protein HQ465_09795 [Rhodospirillales bacterium]|nr:hypothetical protein [Rhodospirillales bacterium]